MEEVVIVRHRTQAYGVGVQVLETERFVYCTYGAFQVCIQLHKLEVECIRAILCIYLCDTNVKLYQCMAGVGIESFASSLVPCSSQSSHYSLINLASVRSDAWGTIGTFSCPIR